MNGRLKKVLAILSITSTLIFTFSALAQEVAVEKGSMKPTGLLQTRFSHFWTGGAVDTFSLRCAEIGFPGKLNEDISYNIRLGIDGGHSYETVKFDFEHYSRLLTDDGIIFFDDYTEEPCLPDVKRYIYTELLPDERFEVTIHEKYIDRYRGHDYKVVSVRFRQREDA